MELKTDLEKMRDERNARIVQTFQSLQVAEPAFKPARYMSAIAKSEKLSLQMVRNILINAGAYSTAKN